MPPRKSGRSEYDNTTEADRDVARRRFRRYIELSRLDDGRTFQELLPLLPKDGASKLRCGHTRFDHTESRCYGA